MRRTLLLFLLTYCATSTFSQQFLGYQYDNYSGVPGILMNPALVAGNKYQVNVNLASFSFLAGNNAYELQKKKFFSVDLSEMHEGTDFFKQNNTDNKHLWLNTDIIGPSFTVSTGPKSGLGFFTRMRTIVNEANLSNNTFQFFNSDVGLFNTDIQEHNVEFKVHSFAEAGLSYARIIKSTPNTTIKIGLSGKYISGIGAFAAHTGDLLVNIAPGKLINQLAGDMYVQYSDNIDNLSSNSISNVYNNRAGNSGWGFDAGISIEWKSLNGKPDGKSWIMNDPSPYKLKLNVSVTDIGAVNYKNSDNGNGYLINGTGQSTSELNKQSSETFNDYFTRLKTDGILLQQDWTDKMKVKLPMAIRANVDWHIYKRLFLAAGAVVNMLNASNKMLSANYITTFSVVPRLEKKWYAIYAPVTYNMQKQFGAGIGFRAGPVFAGSGNIITSYLSSKNISAADFHVGVFIPVFRAHRTKEKEIKEVEKKVEVIKEVAVNKDKDKDGVVDSVDVCPDKAGEVYLKGCPDKDKDSVADIDDKCPDVAGSPRYKGCPVPDTDGDGLNDEVDRCPTYRGSLENHGCPEVKKEVVKKVSSAAKSIYFMTKKAVILKKSYPKLDEIVKVMQADVNLKLTIEGHTDNVGTAARNQVLSARRAQAVKDYLVRRGVEEIRLLAVGYGETQPVASNSTPKGKAKNRRVEMKLHYY